jgi:hypothetical protein
MTTQSLSILANPSNNTAPIMVDIGFRPVEYILWFSDTHESINVKVEPTESNLWLATNPNIMTQGVGGTPDDAMADYTSMIFDLYTELINSEENLAPHLLDELNYLKTLFQNDVL